MPCELIVLYMISLTVDRYLQKCQKGKLIQQNVSLIYKISPQNMCVVLIGKDIITICYFPRIKHNMYVIVIKEIWNLR